MLLVTGPTGSGKTTTLYAAISEINSGQDKIVTIEDPVEYQLAGVLQIPVNEKKGLTFARGLRSILRHDPTRSWWARSATRDRQHRGAVGAHRPPGVHHGAREQRVRRDRPLHAHERRPLQLRLGAERDPRAAPGAHGLPALRRARHALEGGAAGIRACREATVAVEIRRSARAAASAAARATRGAWRSPSS
jgi:hypothetical protein